MQEDFKIKIAKAQKFHEENKLNLARKEYKKLLEQFPKNIDILYLLGTLEIQSNNFKNGTYYLLKAINLNPNVAPLPKSISGMGNPVSSPPKLDRNVGTSASATKAVRTDS